MKRLNSKSKLSLILFLTLLVPQIILSKNQKTEKPRIIVMTDIGNEPDPRQVWALAWGGTNCLVSSYCPRRTNRRSTSFTDSYRQQKTFIDKV